MRLFFALWPNPAVRTGLVQRIADVALPKGRLMRRENLHATLVFLGTVEPARLPGLRAAAARVQAPAFELRIDRGGQFGRAGVVWLGATALPAAAQRLVAELRQHLTAAGFPFDPKPFELHVTIARDVKQRWDPPDVAPLAWPVDSFALVESVSGPGGVVYEVRESWPLESAACR
ncbi:MAG: RNA 2',3'-cyclic phosphodiesterase [Gammaproteobacteria bacterium]|nr:RNA 2',3'-cyclic phosphodiesterase [Gammaproteobacteria bacterium]MBI5616491.1 RNA 2',3'-cyclic phosphodiesterase [Gammaproteobacteria bacterium]